MAEGEPGELVSPAGLYMHPVPEYAPQPVACRSLVASANASQPGCLTALGTLSLPLEQSVQRFSEKFSHALEEVKSRVTDLWRRVDDVARQTAVLGQRQEQIDSQAADLERQQSCLSDDLSSRMSESERRQSQLSEDVQNLSSSLERSTSDLEEVQRQAEGVEGRTQDLEQQAVSLEVRTTLLEQKSDANQTVSSEVNQLKEQITEVCENIKLQSKNFKNWEDSQEETQSLLNRLDSMEKRMQRLESSVHLPQPKRSISSP